MGSAPASLAGYIIIPALSAGLLLKENQIWDEAR
jgi:hypothetical protein